MKPLLLCLALLSLPACAPKTITDPQARVAYTASQIVQRVNELQNAAISANAGGALSLPATRLIVLFCVQADKALKDVPSGWQLTVQHSWADLKRQLPTITDRTIIGILNTVDVALATLGA